MRASYFCGKENTAPSKLTGSCVEINAITTNGVVDSRQRFDRAMDTAQNVKDVKSVENNLVAKGS